MVAEIAAETGVDFMPLNGDIPAASYPIEKQRIGMYQRYLRREHGRGVDPAASGELRVRVHQDVGRTTSWPGTSHEEYDVIILPADSKAMMTGIRVEEVAEVDMGEVAIPAPFRRTTDPVSARRGSTLWMPSSRTEAPW